MENAADKLFTHKNSGGGHKFINAIQGSAYWLEQMSENLDDSIARRNTEKGVGGEVELFDKKGKAIKKGVNMVPLKELKANNPS